MFISARTICPRRPRGRLLGPEAIIGFSTHNLEQAAARCADAGRLHGNRSNLRNVHQSKLLILQLVSTDCDWCAKPLGDLPLVAIGGITFENSQDVLDAGADAVAVISDIWIPAGQAAFQTKRDFLSRLDHLLRTT